MPDGNGALSSGKIFEVLMMSDFTIAPLAAAHVDAVAELFAKQLAEHDVNRSQEDLIVGLETLLAQPERGFILAAIRDGRPIGVAYGACILSLEHGGLSGWLDELYVLPDWRGQGIGSALLSAAIASAAKRGWAALDLEVDSNHRRVIPLYQRHAFQPVSRTRFVRRLR